MKVVSLTLVNQRLVANYLDTRGAVADYDTAHDRLTLTLSSQGPHAIRDVLVQVLNLPGEKLRVITPDDSGRGPVTWCLCIPTCHVRVRGVYTNTVPVDAYRGAGRPDDVRPFLALIRYSN